jgi:nucleotide-binding universal stress UspA family protein
VAFEDILVPTDFGPGSRAALERALDSLGSEGGRVVVLHVIDPRLLEPTRSLFPEVKEADVLTRLREQAHQRYAQLSAGLERAQVECELLLVEGVPFLKIVQFARDLDVDLIVMAVHRGPAHFEQFLFGSTAERVMRVAPCPVLIVPETPVLGEEEVRHEGCQGNTSAAQQ